MLLCSPVENFAGPGEMISLPEQHVPTTPTHLNHAMILDGLSDSSRAGDPSIG